VSYQWPLLTGRVEGGQWHKVIGVVGSGRRQVVDQLLAIDVLPNVHATRCVINV